MSTNEEPKYNIPSVDSLLKKYTINSHREHLGGLENRARKFIVDHILKHASHNIEYAMKDECMEMCVNGSVGIDIFSGLIDFCEYDDDIKHYIAVRRDSPRCYRTNTIEKCACQEPGCPCDTFVHEKTGNVEIDKMIDAQECAIEEIDHLIDHDCKHVCQCIKYFHLCDVLQWPQVQEDLSAILNPLGYDIAVVVSNEGALGKYVRVVASFKVVVDRCEDRRSSLDRPA